MVIDFKKVDIDKLRSDYKYLWFAQFNDMFGEVYFKCFGRHPKGLQLGKVVWNDQWNCWDFLPEENKAFTQDCLADISDFMRQAEKQVKEKPHG